MVKCKNCWSSLVGQHIIAYEDGPLDPGDEIPRFGHRLYETPVGYLKCDCGREIPMTPHAYHDPPTGPL